MNRRVKYIALGLVIIAVLVGSGFFYVRFLGADAAKRENGDFIFADGFEEGLSTWTGNFVTNGAAPVVSDSVMRTGTSSCKFQTYPTLNESSSMIFETISTTGDVYTSAYVYIPDGLSSMQMNDRFYLVRIVYGSSEQVLAEIGIRRNGTEAPRWVVISAKNSSSTDIPKYGQLVDLSALSSTWTHVELRWNKTGGVAEAWINGEKGITAVATPGDIPSAVTIQYGIYKKGDDGVPPPTGEYGVTAYFDDCIMDDEPIGPELFLDGFESGDFVKWTGTAATSGETATVVSTVPYSGAYGGMFTGNGEGGSEGAYSHVTILSSSELYARGYFKVTPSGLADEEDRFFFMIFYAGNEPVAYAGWWQVGDVVEWSLLMRDGTGWVVDFSDSSPALGQWYSVELHWVSDSAAGLGELYVNGERVCSISGKNTAGFGNVTWIGFGLAELYNSGPTTVYGDNFVASKEYIGPEP